MTVSRRSFLGALPGAAAAVALAPQALASVGAASPYSDFVVGEMLHFDGLPGGYQMASNESVISWGQSLYVDNEGEVGEWVSRFEGTDADFAGFSASPPDEASRRTAFDALDLIEAPPPAWVD